MFAIIKTYFEGIALLTVFCGVIALAKHLFPAFRSQGAPATGVLSEGPVFSTFARRIGMAVCMGVVWYSLVSYDMKTAADLKMVVAIALGPVVSFLIFPAYGILISRSFGLGRGVFGELLGLVLAQAYTRQLTTEMYTVLWGRLDDIPGILARLTTEICRALWG